MHKIKKKVYLAMASQSYITLWIFKQVSLNLNFSSDFTFISIVSYPHSRQEMEAEKSHHEQTKLQLAHCDLLLTQKNNELIAITLDRDRLKSRNCDLSCVIRDLQRKYEPGIPLGSLRANDQIHIAYLFSSVLFLHDNSVTLLPLNIKYMLILMDVWWCW